MSMSIPDRKEIKPKERRKSDFFSWNLYEWFRVNPDLVRVYQTNWNQINGYKGGIKRGRIMIGALEVDGWFTGRQIVRASGLVSGQAFAFPPKKKDVYIDITDKFWKRYLRIGVCALSDYRHDFEEITETSRACRNCRRKEVRETKMVPRHTWVKSKAKRK